MKILVFTTLYPNNVWPNQGVFIKERMTQFAGLDECEVKVVAPVPYFPRIKLNWRWRFSQVAKYEVRDGLEVYHPRYFMIPICGMIFYGLLMFISVLRTVKRLRKEFNFDLIDAHFVYPDGFAAVLLGKYFKKPVVVSARGSDINLYSKFSIVRRLLQYTLRQADHVIAVCVALKQAMIELGIAADKIAVVPNGVDVKKFYRVVRADARRKLELPAIGKIILSVGGLIPRKGFDLIIRALKRLTEQEYRENLRLVIAGEGPAKNELIRLVSDLKLNEHVRIVGSIPHSDLYLWYSAADVFCLASSREGWPNVLLESLACGTPIVATNIWGTPEVIQSDQFGFLTERTEDAITDTLAAALRKSWSQDELISYAKSHTWERAAGAVHRVFEEVLNRKSNDGLHNGASRETTSTYTIPMRNG
jgi:teichuronic acid biosynthesis glycosyltransferase TuaC